jgi:hypothetical protein
MAADLVRQGVELIIAAGSEGIVAARDATKSIEQRRRRTGGFAASLDKPAELAGKRLELLREIFSEPKRVGILWNPVHSNTPVTFQEARGACERLGWYRCRARFASLRTFTSD